VPYPGFYPPAAQGASPEIGFVPFKGGAGGQGIVVGTEFFFKTWGAMPVMSWPQFITEALKK